MTSPRDAIRRVDWRFLLHDAVPEAVACLDGVATDPLLLAGLGRIGATAVDADASTGASVEGGFDVVIARDPDSLDRAMALRAPNGSILVETTSRRARRRLDRQIRQSGASVRHYGCWPRCTDATRFVPLHDRRQLLASAEGAKNPRRRAVGTLLARLGLGTFLFRESMSVVTEADRPRPPAPARVAIGDDADDTASMTLLTPRFGSSRHVIALVTDQDGRLRVAKTPRVPGDDEQLESEARGLSSVSGPNPTRPELVADVERFGQRWVVQSGVGGQPLSRSDVAKDPDRWVAAASAWLAQMPVDGRTPPGDDGRVERLLRPALGVVAECADREPELGPLVTDAEQAIAHVSGTPLPVRAEHGDFRPPNLIVTGSGAIAAVDWELAERHGFPLYDLSFFHAYVASVTPEHRSTLLRGRVDALASDGLDADLLVPLMTLASLRQLANLVERSPDTLSVAATRVADCDVVRDWFAALNDHPSLAAGE